MIYQLIETRMHLAMKNNATLSVKDSLLGIVIIHTYIVY